MKGEETIELGGKRLPAGLVWLAVGVPIALVLQWFSCGIMALGTRLFFHETGHALFGWAFGHPSVPTAKGFTVIYDQRLPLVLAVWAALAWSVWRLREARHLAGALAFVALVYPALAWTKAHMLLVDLGGHLAELGFAATFAWLALRGGFSSEAERPVGAALGWFLWTGHVILAWKLMTDGTYRAVYESVSITGGDNDMVKAADQLGWRLEGVARAMFLLGLIVPAAVGGAWWWWIRDEHGMARLRRLLGVYGDQGTK